MPGYPGGEPIVPHGVSVVVNAPARLPLHGAARARERHLEAAALLGADARGAAPADAGEVLGDARSMRMMRATGIPNGLGGVGYGEGDVARAGARAPSCRSGSLDNAPHAGRRARARRALPRRHASDW